MRRKEFLRLITLCAVSGHWSIQRLFGQNSALRPHRLKPGDTIGFVSPGGAIKNPDSLQKAITLFQNMGFNTKISEHALDRWGYYSATDKNRAEDIRFMFSDPEINAIIATRGGSGCNRLLPLLDYDLIKNNPKIFMGYSDITALCNAIFTKTGLITFHGPVVTSTWNTFTRKYFQEILVDGIATTFMNPDMSKDVHDVHTITPGTTSGVLWGGNLSVLSTMAGSEFLPKPDGTILFLEDVEEDIYRIDRMLMHLKLTGILNKINGFIFAQCTTCEEDDPGFSLIEILDQYIKPLEIPAWYGSMAGHIYDKFTLPVGSPVTVDASNGTIMMIERAVD